MTIRNNIREKDNLLFLAVQIQIVTFLNSFKYSCFIKSEFGITKVGIFMAFSWQYCSRMTAHGHSRQLTDTSETPQDTSQTLYVPEERDTCCKCWIDVTFPLFPAPAMAAKQALPGRHSSWQKESGRDRPGSIAALWGTLPGSCALLSSFRSLQDLSGFPNPSGLCQLFLVLASFFCKFLLCSI